MVHLLVLDFIFHDVGFSVSAALRSCMRRWSNSRWVSIRVLEGTAAMYLRVGRLLVNWIGSNRARVVTAFVVRCF